MVTGYDENFLANYRLIIECCLFLSWLYSVTYAVDLPVDMCSFDMGP